MKKAEQSIDKLKTNWNMNDTIINNLHIIRKRIENACIKSNRHPDEVKLLLATKTVSANRILIALKSGNTLIAENKIQELKEKYEVLMDTPHINHFIGHLQTNKIKDVLKYDVACIHSLDRLDLAVKLQQRLEFENKTMEVLIQVNTSNEESKFGVSPDKVVELVQQVSQLDRLKIKGLMTIGLFSADVEKIRPCFRLLRAIQEEIISFNVLNVEMKELSMGMSGDLETAIEEGATIVRVGSAVFGQRNYPDSYYWNEEKASGGD